MYDLKPPKFENSAVVQRFMDVDYEFSPAFTLMTANLGPGESLKVEPGAMVAQSRGVDMKTGMGGGGGIGGFLKSMAKSAFGGESFFVNTYTAGGSGGWVSLAPSAPGDIKEFDLAPGEEFFMQGGAFMACTPSVDTDTKFQGAKALFSREGAFFLRAYTPRGVEGKVFYTSYGAIKEIDVSPGDPVVVDNGHVVAFTSGLTYNGSKVGGMGSAILGGEGIVLEFNGSGKVYIQTRNMESLATRLMPFMPTARSN
jgi:uncharacterized protein (TIGR00266 family)|tara:strand:+ start:32260 stop:33024 length:765 start_codon:yes stop_codon:yes gene_type:complete